MATIKPYNLYPTMMSTNTYFRKDIKFDWDVNNTISSLNCDMGRIEYWNAETPTNVTTVEFDYDQTEENVYVRNSYYLPAYTFPASGMNFIWRIQLRKINDGIWGDWSETSELWTYGSEAEQPIHIFPNGENYYATDEISLSWDYVKSDGILDDVQTKFNIRWKDIVYPNTWHYIEEITDVTSYTFPPNTFNNIGEYNIYFTVSNIDNKESDDVSAKFNIQQPEPTPPTELFMDKEKFYDVDDIYAKWKYIKLGQTDYQSAYQVEYSLDDFVWIELPKLIGETEEYLLPHFEDAEELYWRVKTWDKYGNTSTGDTEWSDSKEFSKVTRTALEPDNIRPNNSIFADDEDILVSWHYTSSEEKEDDEEGDSQKAYNLEYTDEETILIENVTSDSFYNFSSGFFVNDEIKFRIKTQSQDLVWSEWSDYKTFYIAKKPNPPTITTDISFDNPYPIFNWSSVDQKTIDFKIVCDSETIYATDEIVNNENTIQSEKYLENGKIYSIILKIKNQYGLWSDETIQDITVNYITPSPATINGGQVNNGYQITIDNFNSDLNYKILRKELTEDNWIEVGDTSTNTFIDNTSTHLVNYDYKVFALNNVLGQSESNIIKGSCIIHNTQISSEDIDLELKWNPSKSRCYNLNVNTFNYLGRKKPTFQKSSYFNTTNALSFEIYDYEDLEKIIAISTNREKIRIRDSRKKNIVGVIINLDIQDVLPNYWDIKFNIEEVE